MVLEWCILMFEELDDSFFVGFIKQKILETIFDFIGKPGKRHERSDAVVQPGYVL